MFWYFAEMRNISRFKNTLIRNDEFLLQRPLIKKINALWYHGLDVNMYTRINVYQKMNF